MRNGRVAQSVLFLKKTAQFHVEMEIWEALIVPKMALIVPPRLGEICIVL